MKILLAVGCVLGLGSCATSWAGEADVLHVEAYREEPGTFRFEVTLRHDDEGWQHYANAWEVVDLDGAVLATRTLHHPHVAEQPFTRSLSGVQIEEPIARVEIRARDSVHGYGGRALVVDLPR